MIVNRVELNNNNSNYNDSLWYESRELISNEDLNQDISSTSLPVRQEDEESDVIKQLIHLHKSNLISRCVSSKASHVNLFKPNHGGNIHCSNNVDIFRTDNTASNLDNQASAILKLQHKLSQIYAKISRLELWLDGNISAKSNTIPTTANSHNSIIGNLMGILNMITNAKLFWFAWPIFVMSILDNRI